jgi:hypothetical protein
VFVISFYYLFPVGKFLNFYIYNYITDNNIPIYYNDISKQSGKIIIRDLIVKPNESIGDITCKYGLFNILLGKTECSFQGNVEGSAFFSLNNFKINLRVNFDNLNLGGNKIKGISQIKGSVKKIENRLSGDIIMDKLLLVTDMLPLELKRLKAKFNLKSNLLTVEKIVSEGSPNIFLRGKITINYDKFKFSKINLNGKFNMGNTIKKIAIIGNFDNCRVIFN